MDRENKSERKRLNIPDFKKESEQQYQYANRANRYNGESAESQSIEKKPERVVKRTKNTGYKGNTVNTKKKHSAKKNSKSKNSVKRGNSEKRDNNMKSQKRKSTTPQVSGKRKKIKKNKLLTRFLVATMLIASVTIGGIAGKMHAQFNLALNQRNEGEFDLEEVVVDETMLDSDEEIINILLVGADKRASWSEVGRSDATMVATIDRKHKRLKLTSLMRDMYVDIPNHGRDKFNASYSYGGIPLLYQTIAYNFDLKIDGYILVDFAAFKKVINKLGGVKIELTQAEANYLITAYKTGTVTKVKAGMNKLNGAQALAYTRIRQDVEADFGRTARQRKVLQSLFTKMKTKSYSQLIELMSEVMPYITTDLSNDEIFAYMADVITMGTTEIDQKRIPINGAYTTERIGGKEVLIPDIDVNKKEFQNFIFEYNGEA